MESNTQPQARPEMIQVETVLEHLDDAAARQQRLAEDPGDAIASARLESMYRKSGDWDALLRLLLDRAETCSPRESAQALLEVAIVYARDMGEAESAMVVLLTAFDRDPSSAAVADGLDELAASSGNYDELIDAYVVAAANFRGRDDRMASELWLRTAWAYVASGRDFEAALAAIDRVVDAHTAAARAIAARFDSLPATTEAGRLATVLARKLGDDAGLLRALTREATTTHDAFRKSELHGEIAELYVRRKDLASAEWHLVESIRQCRDNQRSVKSLVNVYKELGESRKAAQLIEYSRAGSGDRDERAALHLEAAKIYADLNEHTVAANLFESALAVDPSHIGAAQALVDRYFDNQRWHELVPLLDLLIQSGSTDGVVYHRAGVAAHNLGKHALATDYLATALRIDPGNNAALNSLAEAHTALGNRAAASKCYEQLLARADDSAEYADCSEALGGCRAAMGHNNGAIEAYKQALAADATRSTAWAALAQLCVATGKGEAAASAYRNAARNAASDTDKVEFLLALAELTSRDLRDPIGAIAVYRTVLAVDGSNRDALYQLVEHFSAAAMWSDALDAVVSISEIESDAMRRGKYLQAGGDIARKKLHDTEAAADCYEAALDCFYASDTVVPEAWAPSCEKAFRYLGAMLAESQQWKRLERAYRLMIKRVDPRSPIAAELWHGLGEIYRKHLDHREAAIGSFEVASALDTKRLTRHKILVDLYEQAGPGKAAEAIARRQRLVAAEPTRWEHYKALRTLYAQTGQYDKAWSACRALCVMGQADEEEQRFYESRAGHVGWAARPMTDEDWAHIADLREDRNISAVLAEVAHLVGVANGTPRAQFPVDGNAPGTAEFQNLTNAVCDGMGVEAPEVSIRSDVAGNVLWASVRSGTRFTPVAAIGADLCNGAPMPVMVSRVAVAAANLRREYMVRIAANTVEEFEAVFLAAATLVRNDVPVPAHLAPSVSALHALFVAELDGNAKRRIAGAVSRYVDARRSYDMAEWSMAAEQTSRRAALLMSGDLHTTVEGLASDTERVRLIAYSVSELHFELCNRLGVSATA